MIGVRYMDAIKGLGKGRFVGNWRRQRQLTQACLYLVLSFAAVVVLFPFYYMIISSLREPFYRFDAIELDLLPTAFNLVPYRTLLTATLPGVQEGHGVSASLLLNGLKNTLILEVVILVTSTFLNGLAAYALAKRSFPGKEALFALLISTIILPGEVTLVPKYVMFYHWRLLGTLWPLILPSFTSVFGIFLMRQFMSSIPDAYLEAARIDGANELQIIMRVVFPLSMPVMATYGLFTFLGVWNDLMGPLIFLKEPETWPLTLALYSFVNSMNPFNVSISDPTGMLMQKTFAGLILSAVPPVVVFLIFQRRLVSGITLTGLRS